MYTCIHTYDIITVGSMILSRMADVADHDAHALSLDARIYICVCIYIYIYIYIFMHIYTHLYTHIHIHIYIYIYIYAYAYAYAYAYVCISLSLSLYIYIYIYTRIHTLYNQRKVMILSSDVPQLYSVHCAALFTQATRYYIRAMP